MTFKEWLAEREATEDDLYEQNGVQYAYNRKEGKLEKVPQEYLADTW